jgi:hypothetical protein
MTHLVFFKGGSYMRAKYFSTLGFLVVSSLALAGCGTLRNGGNQKVDVVVKGSPSAFCVFTNGTATNSGTFPNKVVLERSQKTLQAECYGEQNLYKKFEIKAGMSQDSTLGNIGTGIVPGLATDTLSGGAWYYPNPIIVDFRTVDAPPKKIWPLNRADAPNIGTAPIEKPNHVYMKPVIDEQLNPALGTPILKKPAPVKIEHEASSAPYKPATQKPQPIIQKGVMKPVVSPEDNPAVLKAKAEARKKQEAEKKAAAEAVQKAQDAKAKEDAAKAAAEKAAAEKAEAEKPAAPVKAEPKVETLPESTTPAPAESAPTTAAPAPTAPKTNTEVDVDKYLKGQ